jgi:hypothetical protein
LPNILRGKPEIVAFRECLPSPLMQGHSFSLVSHSRGIVPAQVTHAAAVLELIYNHLQACGMVHTAEMLVEECGATFQLMPQPWDRTHLQLLIAGSLRQGRDVWAPPEGKDEVSSALFMESDLIVTPYVDRQPEILDAIQHFGQHILWIRGDRRRLTDIRACSLPGLVIFFALPDGGNEEDRDMLLLSMPWFTTGSRFIEYLAAFFHLNITDSDLSGLTTEANVLPMMCRRIINFMKAWLDYAPSRQTLLTINEFLDGVAGDSRIQGIDKAIESIKTRISELLGGKARPQRVRSKSKSKVTVPSPLIPHHQIPFLFEPNLNIFDLDPIEVARQITLLQEQKYVQIQIKELFETLKNVEISDRLPSVANFFAFDRCMTIVFGRFFISADNQRKAYQRLIAIARALQSLGNAHGTDCLVRFLMRDSVMSLAEQPQAEWDDIPILALACGTRKDDQRIPDAHPYEIFTKTNFLGWTATIPNLHAELDICAHLPARTSPDYVKGLLNWEKISPIASRLMMCKRFQAVRYKLMPVPQIQRPFVEVSNLTLPEIEMEIHKMRCFAKVGSTKTVSRPQ